MCFCRFRSCWVLNVRNCLRRMKKVVKEMQVKKKICFTHMNCKRYEEPLFFCVHTHAVKSWSSVWHDNGLNASHLSFYPTNSLSILPSRLLVVSGSSAQYPKYPTDQWRPVEIFPCHTQAGLTEDHDKMEYVMWLNVCEHLTMWFFLRLLPQS